MLGSRNFRAATAAKTPQFAAATARQGELEQQAMQQANALRSQNMLGAAQVYNKGMGDRSPIADFSSDMYNNVFSDPELPMGESAVVGRDAGSIDPMNIGDGSDVSNVTGGDTLEGEFDPQGNWLGEGSGTIDDAGSTIMDADTAIDTGVRSDLISAIDAEVAGEVGGEVAGEVAGNVAGEAADALGGLGGITKIATAEDPAGELAAQAGLQGLAALTGVGALPTIANLLRTLV